jgi:DNA-binding transcriptional MocR family regulator
MSEISSMGSGELRAFHEDAQRRYDAFRAQKVSANLGRGKPSNEQLDLSNELLSLPGAGGYTAADKTDTRNYGGLQGLPELRAIFANVLGAPVDRILASNNSSLQLMHDVLAFAMLHGVPGGQGAWVRSETTFLCPVPGYDRHFTICDGFGIKMVTVPLTGDGPDMDVVERLVREDASIRGMWCIPKYSNPTGDIYSPEVVERLAAMKTAAPDFRLMWDNAYAVHHLTSTRYEIANVLEACAQHGHPNRALVFASTSKITFAGAGVSLMAASADNMKWMLKQMERQSIGPDKVNQLRHARFLRDEAGLLALMDRHAAILAPKFAEVRKQFAALLGHTGAARWTDPKGGYFVSLDVMDGCATRVIDLAKQAGITVVPPGSTFPHLQDPDDRNIRVAPSFPNLAEVTQAAIGLALSTLVAASEKVLSTRGETVVRA